MNLEGKRTATFWAFFFLVLLSPAFLLLPFPCSSLAYEQEEIRSFDSRIWVQPSGSVTVTETITANCLGKNIRHGIYRDIPVEYKTGLLTKMRPRFRILKVMMDGSHSPFHTKRIGDSIRIYIGSKHRYVSKGLHTFSLSYEMGRMVRLFQDFDEIYWNVTGDEWKFPILKASCTVILPKPGRFVQYASYTGSRGSKSTMAKVVNVTDRQISFETTDILYPGQGLTIAAAWPKGIIHKPTSLEKALFLFRDNFSVLSSLILLLCTLLYYLYAWTQVGKDPEIGPIVPSFNPPKNIGPSAARFIRQMGFDDKTFATSLVNLAVKGLVVLKKDKKGFSVARTGKVGTGGLTEGEAGLLSSLFSSGPEISLSQANFSKISSAKKSLKSALKRKYERVYFLTNQKYLIPGLVLSVLALVALAAGGKEIIASLFITVWLTVWTFFSIFLLWNGVKGLKGFSSLPWRQKAAAVRNFFFSMVFSIGLVIGGSFYYMIIGPINLVIFFCLIAGSLVFYQLMKAPTMRGASLLSDLEGFRMFLKTAEAPRLQALTPPDKAPELFERYLPWAMALDVENQWAERFQKYLESIGQPTTYQPAWYYGSSYNLTSLSSDVGSGLGSVISTASMSHSSGSGGGGFSGGGGGGGGGGGW